MHETVNLMNLNVERLHTHFYYHYFVLRMFTNLFRCVQPQRKKERKKEGYSYLDNSRAKNRMIQFILKTQTPQM